MHHRWWPGLCALALVALSLGPASAQAQPGDKRTYFTFSGPVAIPGVTLPAGKYLFRLADTSSRDVVQVLSEDGRKPYAMFFALRVERFDVPEKPEVRFMETAEGMPAAIRTWWYPGDRTGYEFAYPREQAERLAQGGRQPVLTARTEPPAPPAPTPAPELSRLAPSGEETSVPAEVIPPATAVTGRSLEGEIAPPSVAIAATPQPSEMKQARATLPKTASATPRWAAAGLGLLICAAVLRAVRRRTA